MACQNVGKSVRMPVPAKACLKFLQHREAKECGCSEPSVCGLTAEKLQPEVSRELPVILGARDNYSKRVSFDGSPYATPTTTDGFERDLSDLSTSRSTSTVWDDLESSHSNSSWKLAVKNTFVHVTDSSDDEFPFGRSNTEPSRSVSNTPRLQIPSRPHTWTSLPLSQSMRPSVGSVLHGSGLCKPCAWLWKPTGCANGVECRHCHLCPEGEIRRRRKVNQSTRRRKGIQQSESSSLRQELPSDFESN